ncbi:MAG: HEAT repeat domain-containing protein, partial [Chloroflexota bacterium]
TLSRAGLSKYNLGGDVPDLPGGRRVLVVGQVEDDASIRTGAGAIRTNAAQALGRTGTKEALQPLIRHLQDPDSRVSLAAATALGQLSFADAATPLFDAAHDENTYYRLRDVALEALVQINPPDINEKLFSLLDTHELPVRKAVVEVIQSLDSEDDVERLLDVADWHTSLVRPVRNALVRCGGEAVERVMIASVGHVRQWVRALAVEVLGEIQSRAATTHILPVLQDDVQEVRLLAVNALGEIGDKRAVPQLIATLKDPVWLVQVAASSALARIDSAEAREASDDWQRTQRGRPSPLDLDTDEPPPDVDLSDIL